MKAPRWLYWDRRHTLRNLAFIGLFVAVFALAGCDLNQNPRYDACAWHNSAKDVNTKWMPSSSHERGGWCHLTAGVITAARKAECERVIKARGSLGQYAPPLASGDARQYCYDIK